MSTKLLTEKEAAPILGMSVAWVQRKRWEGGGPPFIKYDRAVRYREEDLLQWVDDHTRQNGFPETYRGARCPTNSKEKSHV